MAAAAQIGHEGEAGRRLRISLRQSSGIGSLASLAMAARWHWANATSGVLAVGVPLCAYPLCPCAQSPVGCNFGSLLAFGFIMPSCLSPYRPTGPTVLTTATSSCNTPKWLFVIVLRIQCLLH